MRPASGLLWLQSPANKADALDSLQKPAAVTLATQNCQIWMSRIYYLFCIGLKISLECLGSNMGKESMRNEKTELVFSRNKTIPSAILFQELFENEMLKSSYESCAFPAFLHPASFWLSSIQLFLQKKHCWASDNLINMFFSSLFPHSFPIPTNTLLA